MTRDLPGHGTIDFAQIFGLLSESATVWNTADDRRRVVVEIDDGGESVDAHLSLDAAEALAKAILAAVEMGRGL